MGNVSPDRETFIVKFPVSGFNCSSFILLIKELQCFQAIIPSTAVSEGLQLFRQYRQKLLEVGHGKNVGHITDRSIPVGVDRHDEI